MLSCSYLCRIPWSQMLSREWRCSWSSADRRCSNYIWVIDNLIADWCVCPILEVLRYLWRLPQYTRQIDLMGRSCYTDVLLQDGRPIAYASRSLTDTESNYSNIEREMLGIVFGLERFHHYVFGPQVVVKSDHKPLESITKKNIAKVPPRLQRMLLRIQPYDF